MGRFAKVIVCLVLVAILYLTVTNIPSILSNWNPPPPTNQHLAEDVLLPLLKPLLGWLIRDQKPVTLQAQTTCSGWSVSLHGSPDGVSATLEEMGQLLDRHPPGSGEGCNREIVVIEKALSAASELTLTNDSCPGQTDGPFAVEDPRDNQTILVHFEGYQSCRALLILEKDIPNRGWVKRWFLLERYRSLEAVNIIITESGTTDLQLKLLNPDGVECLKNIDLPGIW